MSSNNNNNNNTGNINNNGPPSTRPQGLARVQRPAGDAAGMNNSGHSDSNTNRAPSRMNAPRSHVKRSLSFKRTAGGSSGGTMLGSDDQASGNSNVETGRRALSRNNSSTSDRAPGSLMSMRQNSTRFVKNFLEDDLVVDEHGNVVPPGSAPAPAADVGTGMLQFDAETQRSAHRNLLLNPSPPSPPNKGSPTQGATNRKQASKNEPPAKGLFQPRDDFHNVDQSVNLMDAEAGKYESKEDKHKKGKNGSSHGGTSMVEIFLKEHSSPDHHATTSNGKTRYGWHHPQTKAQWAHMTTWDKLVDVCSRLVLPLVALSILVLVILIVVVIHYGTKEELPEVEVAPSADTATAVTDAPFDFSGPDEVVATPTEEAAALTKLFTDLAIVSQDELNDPDSSAAKAMSWMSQDKIALAGLPDTGRRHLVSATDMLVQRFVLAVLYYEWQPKNVDSGNVEEAAQAALDSNSLKPGGGKANAGQAMGASPWLTEQSECNWMGVSCHNEINELQMGVSTVDAVSEGGNVRKVNLTAHELTGTLPPILTKLTHLTELDLRDNKLSGNFDSLDLTKWDQIEFLLLGKNELTGTIPEDITGMQRIIDIDISNNKLEGKLPALTDGQIKLEDLENLFLNGNALTGTIPNSFLRDLPHINYMDLSSNKLSGHLPGYLWELQQLRFFHAQENELSGELPRKMSPLLDTLWLGQNKLKGHIPESLLSFGFRVRHLRLDGNALEGHLPEKLGELTNMKEVHLQDNQFEGTVPASWGAMTHLEELQLQGNPLTGVVPEEVCALVSDDTDFKVTTDCDSGSITCDCCNECF